LESFLTSIKFEPPALGNTAGNRTLKQCNAVMIALCPRQFWWSWSTLSSKMHDREC